MIKHVADDEYADAAIMTKFLDKTNVQHGTVEWHHCWGPEWFFLHDKGKKGSFSPASISNMTSKYTKELDLLSDVSPDMTQAERTIALLNK